MERSSDRPLEDEARELNGHHALEVTRTEAVKGRWIRYHVRDSKGEEHCVGVRAEGFFTAEDLQDMAEVDIREPGPASIDDVAIDG